MAWIVGIHKPMHRETWVFLVLVSKSIEIDIETDRPRWSLLLPVLTSCMYCWEIWAQGAGIER